MSKRTVLPQCLQDQKHTAQPLEIQVPNIYRDKVLQKLKPGIGALHNMVASQS